MWGTMSVASIYRGTTPSVTLHVRGLDLSDQAVWPVAIVTMRDAAGGSALESYSGIEVTGFIPCANGDIVRLSGIAMSKGDSDAGSVDRISFYDSSKVHIKTMNVLQSSVGWWDATYDASGNLTKFKNESGATSAYMRLSAHEIDADSVITVNEEIE